MAQVNRVNDLPTIETMKTHVHTSQRFLERAAQLSGLKVKPPILNVNKEFDDKLTLGQRIADAVASTMGSWRFIIIQSAILVVWILLNITAFLEHWDPYPFVFLNLMLSFQAAYAAPFIMMSQNRQSDKDRLAAQNDFDVNKLGEIEIQAVLLHLEEQDRFMLQILERLDSFQVQPALNSPAHLTKVTSTSETNVQKITPDHRQKIEADMWAVVHDKLEAVTLSPTEVCEMMEHCYAVINLESFQRNCLIDQHFSIDESKMSVLRILFKEVFVSVGANFDNPDVEDLNEVRTLLLQRMKYRSIDAELIDKYAEISQKLICKIPGANC